LVDSFEILNITKLGSLDFRTDRNCSTFFFFFLIYFALKELQNSYSKH